MFGLIAPNENDISATNGKKKTSEKQIATFEQTKPLSETLPRAANATKKKREKIRIRIPLWVTKVTTHLLKPIDWFAFDIGLSKKKTFKRFIILGPGKMWTIPEQTQIKWHYIFNNVKIHTFTRIDINDEWDRFFILWNNFFFYFLLFLDWGIQKKISSSVQ